MADNENLGAPQSRNEALLQNILGESYDLGEPQSRNEALLMKIAGEDVDVDFEPQSRIEALLMEIIEQGGGGGVEVEPLSVTENGTYTAPSGVGYSPVTVDVAGDDTLEKIMSNTLTKFENDYSGVLKCSGLLHNQRSLTEIKLPNVTQIGYFAPMTANNFANGCISLVNIIAPKLQRLMGDRIFTLCSSLVNVVLPSLYYFYGQKIFESCSNLESFDMGNPNISGKNDASIEQYTFNGCSKLGMMVLRHGQVEKLGSTNAFSNTPFASNGTGGTLYVPNDLIASYQSATNWSTILGYANNQTKSIESTHTDPTAPIDLTTHYADGTLIPT